MDKKDYLILRINREDKKLLSIEADKLRLNLSSYCRMILIGNLTNDK